VTRLLVVPNVTATPGRAELAALRELGATVAATLRAD